MKLKDLVNYSNTKILSETLNPENYVGIDNLIDNQGGKSRANIIPLSGKSNIFEPNDILIGNIRPYLKKIWLADVNGGASQDVLILHPKTSDSPYFLYYLLKQDHFFEYIMQGSKGTRMPRGDKEHILEYEFPDISPNDQKVLNDFLMHLYILENRLKEEFNFLADFMQKSFQQLFGMDSKIVDSSELTLKNLDEIIESINTGLNPRDNFCLGIGDNYYVTIKNIESNKVLLDNKCDKIDADALALIRNRSKLDTGDVLFTSIEPVGLTYQIPSTPRNWDINESVFSIKPSKKFPFRNYFFQLLSSEEMKQYSKNVSAGSIHKGIRHSELKAFTFNCPSDKVLKSYEKFANPISERKTKLAEIIVDLQTLTSMNFLYSLLALTKRT